MLLHTEAKERGKDMQKKSAPKTADVKTTGLHTLDYQGHTVRTIKRDGTIWLALLDIVNIFELTDCKKLSGLVRDAEKMTIASGSSEKNKLLMISQEGLFGLRESKEFKKLIKKAKTTESGGTGLSEFMRWIGCTLLPMMQAVNEEPDSDVSDASGVVEKSTVEQKAEKAEKVKKVTEVKERGEEVKNAKADEKVRVIKFCDDYIRMVMTDDDLWFAADDVCRALKISKMAAALKAIDEDEKMSLDSLDAVPGTNFSQSQKTQKTTEVSAFAVSTLGLYALMAKGDKTVTGPFKAWLKSDVLPLIYGSRTYVMPENVGECLSRPDVVEELLRTLQAEQQKVKTLTTVIEENRPKVQFADAVAAADDCVLVGTLAKFLRQNGARINPRAMSIGNLGITGNLSTKAGTTAGSLLGEKNFFEWLRYSGYLIKCRGERYNLPTAESIQRGFFKVRESIAYSRCSESDSNSGGPAEAEGTAEAVKAKVFRTPVITSKGQQYFIELFLGGRVENLDIEEAMRKLQASADADVSDAVQA